jgi:hypothetical protein
MPTVSSKLLLDWGELKFDELLLQRGLLWTCGRPMRGVRSRKVHDVDGIVRMHPMWRRQVFNSCCGHRDIDMPTVSSKLLLYCGELNFDELHLQRGLLWVCWRPVHSVRWRKVHDVDGSVRLHLMWRRKVFNSCCGLEYIDMPTLSSKLLLAWGELNFDELHLQRGLLGACRRPMRGVRSRKVHDVDGFVRVHLMWRRKVFNSCRGHRYIDMPTLSSKLLLDWGELNFDELHLQRGLLWTCRRPVHGVRWRKVHDVDGSVRVHLMWRRKVFNSCCGLEYIDMPIMFDRLLVACGEFNLPLQRGLLGAQW